MENPEIREDDAPLVPTVLVGLFLAAVIMPIALLLGGFILISSLLNKK